MGCNIIQEVKGLTNKLCFVLLSRKKNSFYAKFQVTQLFTMFTCFYVVVACSIVRTIGKTGSKRNNNKLHNYALPRKKICKYLSLLVLRLVSFTSS